MRDGLNILNSRNCGNGVYLRFTMDNQRHWWLRYLECRDQPCSAGSLAIAGEDGMLWTLASAAAAHPN
jgi:hypothetical protein